MALLPWLLVLFFAQSGVAPASTASQAQEHARHVQVSLSIRDGKTVFRSGEPIRLIVSFTADRPGYQLDTTIDKNARMEDQIQISPEDGVFRWRELLSTPNDNGRDYASITALSTQPVAMAMPLNYWFRFDEPGEYTVRVSTRRVRVAAANMDGMRLPSLTTNEVRFKVVMMTEHEEEIEARRLSALLDTLPPNDLTAQTERCEDLAFLTGDAGTREKVRRYLNPQGRYDANWTGDLGMGLYISRSTSLVIGLLEADMRDPAKPVAQIWNLVNLRLWLEMPGLVTEAQGDMNALRRRKRERSDAFRAEYVNEAIASLPQRTRPARRETAASLISILRNTYPSPDPPAPLPAAVRKVVIDEFAELEPMTQGYLVQQHWKDIRDPKLLPALEGMLTSSDSWVREQPMAAILDIAPERAKPLFIAEMLRPRPVDNGAFLELKDETLPEMDGPLLDQIIALAASSNPRDKYSLRIKTGYLARYASAAILTEIRQLYEARGSQLEQDTRVNLHAYLDRWDEAGAAQRLERALAAEKDASMLLYRLAQVRYSKAQDAVNRIRVDSADPRTVQEAASLISQYGPADGRGVLEARLNRWLNEWSGRAAELEPDPKKTSPQAALQISLIRAILNGKAWKVSEADAALLKQNCMTEACRRAVAIR